MEYYPAIKGASYSKNLTHRVPEGLGMPLYLHNSHHRAKHTTEASKLLFKDWFPWSRLRRVVTTLKWELLTTQITEFFLNSVFLIL